MICTPSPRPPRSEWATNLMLRAAAGCMSDPFVGAAIYYASRRLERAAEEELADARIVEDRLRAILQPCAPELEHDAVVGVLERALRVLLDQQQRDAAVAQAPQQPEEGLDEDRREPDRRLV